MRRAAPIVAGVVKNLDSSSLLLGGDFNSTPWSFARRRDDRAFGLQRLTRGMFSWPAWAGALTAFPIDHVYAGADWRLLDVRRGPNLGSDHYPLVVRVARR